MADQKQESPVKLPSFGRPRRYGLNKCFPQVDLFEYGRGMLSKGVTLRERRMLDFIGTITDKPDWHRKVFDEAIVEKWRNEARDMPRVADNDVYMSEIMFDNCISEIRDKATRFDVTGLVGTLDAELAVVKSDVAVSEHLAAQLRQLAEVLENAPDTQKDWHPGSDNQVLDLLHPSLFPVVFGRTRALRTGKVGLDDAASFSGKGELTSDVEEGERLRCGEDSYQWLPSDVVLSDSGASITSYINNLRYEHHRELYKVLEQFVVAAVPLWEECLSWWNDRRRFTITDTSDEDDFFIPEGIEYTIPDQFKNSDGTINDEYRFEPEYEDWEIRHGVLKFREPDLPYEPFEKKVDLGSRCNLKENFPKGLQIIFKLANIHLTPDKPSYAGGTWHVEGTASECICATAIYYYDEENITESRLSFRQEVDEENMSYIPAQGAYRSLEKYFGVVADGNTVQELGSVVTREGRLLAFPNVLQHKVGSFRLKDPEKPGHRKILAMFLIDPHRRILSTANVPPQQKDWWADHVRQTPAFQKLPPELFSEIINSVDTCPISLDEAKEIRKDLMFSRSVLREEQDELLNERRRGEEPSRQKSDRFTKKAKNLPNAQYIDSEADAGSNSQDFQAVSLLDSDDDLDNAEVDDGMSTDEGEDSEDSLDSLAHVPLRTSSRKRRQSPNKGMKDAPSDDDDMGDMSSIDDSSDEGSNRAGPRSKRNDPSTFSTSLQKILGTKLSTSRRSDPVLARSAAAREASRRIVDAALEEKAKRQLRLEKRVALEKGRVKDVLIASNASGAEFGDATNGDSETTATILETERKLRKVAQRGVVKLFNAVRAAQVKAAEAERTAKKEGVLGIDKRDAKITEMSRKGFLDLIASGGGGLKKGGLEEA
ncbi:duf1665 domain containing protein [Grosmannia clavigera kw1407]|uniref:Duf1665 domain containing protein n=1 Tax=Grosmannia clavigera (strain kw1407 / UAMH 11150) TaxID=655863 RepID=F0XNW2_GROCL|nr:duf1665 domain containing protein [Grosmannia clavigera kw1407]EFX00262.1 duf1665 domain containing protein [Grosmannia clavigera kw1407]